MDNDCTYKKVHVHYPLHKRPLLIHQTLVKYKNRKRGGLSERSKANNFLSSKELQIRRNLKA